MSTTEFRRTSQDMMALLPSLYRVADANPTTDDGYLHTLAGIVGEQLEELQDDLRQLYDDLFIETCAPWVVPYIGELVGVLPSRDIGSASLTTRAQVANVIALRRRKGTADVVEELAESITGWASRVVEMFERVATTQNLNHQRAQATTISLRSARELELVGTAFDPFGHSADVGWIRSRQGQFRPQNLAIFLWPEVPIPFVDTDALAVDAQRFRLHPLGIDTMLVTQRRSDTEINQASTLEEVPWPISRRILDHSLDTSTGSAGLYGPNASILIATAEGIVPRTDVITCALGDVSDGSGDWDHVADIEADQVAVDPQTGRLVLGTDRTGPVRVSFAQSFTGAVGGGYPHEIPFELADETHEIVIRDGAGPEHATITAALAAVAGDGDVLIDDSATYTESLSFQVNADRQVTIASNSTTYPVISAADGITVDCADGASLHLNGLLVSGPLVVTGTPRTVTLRNCTFVPGHSLAPDKTPVHANEPSVVLAVDPADTTPELIIDNCIVGAILAPEASVVNVTDSIVDAGPTPASEPTDQLVAVSEDLSTLPALGAGPNLLQVLVSGHDPVLVDVGEPASISDLVAQIDAAGPIPDIRSGTLDDRIMVAARADLSIRNASPDDDTATALGFTTESVRSIVRGRPTSAPLVFDRFNPGLMMRVGATPAVPVTFEAPPSTIDDAAIALQAAIRNAGDGPVFSEALVFALGERLVVVPGESDTHLAFSGSPADPDSVAVLGLQAGIWAIAADGAGATGPKVRIERSTVLGRVRASAVTLVSDSILQGRLVADRGQTGCVRFSYLPEDSVTPRRYRCVPNHDCNPQLALTSERYGDFRFGELVPTESMIPIRYGSSVGAEMGVFASFQHREREQSLTFNLDEFMRFSMEAGLLDGRTPPGG